MLAEGPRGALGAEGGTRACRWDRGCPGHSLGRRKGVRLHPPGALRLWRGEWELGEEAATRPAREEGPLVVIEGGRFDQQLLAKGQKGDSAQF